MSVWSEVGDRVFARRYAFYDQNIGAILGDDGVLIVDTRVSHRQADEILSDLRELTPLPVRAVVNHLGRGHTDNDIAVLVPDADVLFAGDLVEADAPPYFGDGYPLEWPATIGRLVELVTGAVVPGHGTVGDRAFVVRSMVEIRTIAELAGLVHEGRLPIEEAVLRTPYPADAARQPLERALAQLRGELD
jgi:hypothetical protein